MQQTFVFTALYVEHSHRKETIASPWNCENVSSHIRREAHSLNKFSLSSQSVTANWRRNGFCYGELLQWIKPAVHNTSLRKYFIWTSQIVKMISIRGKIVKKMWYASWWWEWSVWWWVVLYNHLFFPVRFFFSSMMVKWRSCWCRQIVPLQRCRQEALEGDFFSLSKCVKPNSFLSWRNSS